MKPIGAAALPAVLRAAAALLRAGRDADARRLLHTVFCKETGQFMATKNPARG